MEALATLLAFVVGAISLVRFYSKKNNTFLFIGTGFLGTANRSAERIFGYEEQELIGRSVAVLVPDIDHDERVSGYYSRVADGGTDRSSTVVGHRRRVTAKRKDGTHLLYASEARD